MIKINILKKSLVIFYKYQLNCKLIFENNIIFVNYKDRKHIDLKNNLNNNIKSIFFNYRSNFLRNFVYLIFLLYTCFHYSQIFYKNNLSFSLNVSYENIIIIDTIYTNINNLNIT